MKPIIVMVIVVVIIVIAAGLFMSPLPEERIVSDIENRSLQPKADELFNQYKSYVDQRGQFLNALINEEITIQEYIQELKKLETKLVKLTDDYLAEDLASSEQFAGTDVMDFLKEIRQEIENLDILQTTEDALTTTYNESIQDTQNNCDPSYPDVCIPPYPPDLDCGEISFKKFEVLQPDPHGFDGDKDGIGCES